MRDYAKVAPSFWTRGSGKKLRGNPVAQIVALYLVTCPNANMIGVFYVPFVTIVHETGLTPNQVTQALKDLAASDFAHFDHDAELAWVPNAASYQMGDGMDVKDNRRKGLIRELSTFGQHPFVTAFYQKYAIAFSLEKPSWVSDPLVRGPSVQSDPFEGARNQEQYQEQEQERGGLQGASVPSVPDQPESEGITPLKSKTVSFAAYEVYAEAARRALGGFTTGRYGADEVQAAINGHARPGLSWAVLRAKIQDSVTRYINDRRDQAKFESGFSPKKWGEWLNAGNGWTLGDPPEPEPQVDHDHGLPPPISESDRQAAIAAARAIDLTKW